MLVVAGGNADNQAGNIVRLIAESNAFRVLANDNPGAQHAVFGFYGTVRHRDGFSQVSGGQRFTRQHGIHIVRLNVAAGDQHLTGKADSLGLIFSGQVEENVVRAELKQILIALGAVKSVIVRRDNRLVDETAIVRGGRQFGRQQTGGQVGI